jgi:hypothetical protein
MLFVTVPVAPIITGIIVHFRFHIRCISIITTTTTTTGSIRVLNQHSRLLHFVYAFSCPVNALYLCNHVFVCWFNN